jgi:hypothetical protein
MKLELNLEEVQLVLSALAKLPLEICLPTFENIKKQAEEQLKQPSVEESKGTN